MPNERVRLYLRCFLCHVQNSSVILTRLAYASRCIKYVSRLQLSATRHLPTALQLIAWSRFSVADNLFPNRQRLCLIMLERFKKNTQNNLNSNGSYPLEKMALVLDLTKYFIIIFYHYPLKLFYITLIIVTLNAGNTSIGSVTHFIHACSTWFRKRGSLRRLSIARAAKNGTHQRQIIPAQRAQAHGARHEYSMK